MTVRHRSAIITVAGTIILALAISQIIFHLFGHTSDAYAASFLICTLIGGIGAIRALAQWNGLI